MLRGDFPCRGSNLGYEEGGICYILSKQKAHRHFPKGFSDTTFVYCSITVLLSQGLSRQCERDWDSRPNDQNTLSPSVASEYFLQSYTIFVKSQYLCGFA